jgi:hypothetical protein
MRIEVMGVAVLLLSADVAAAAAAKKAPAKQPSAPAGRLAPNDIKTLFFTGEPFTASTTSSLKFKMVFTPEGSMTREPVGRAGGKSEGKWRLSKDGFCSTWKGSRENCYRMAASGSNRWSVIAGTTAVAYWSK